MEEETQTDKRSEPERAARSEPRFPGLAQRLNEAPSAPGPSRAGGRAASVAGSGDGDGDAATVQPQRALASGGQCALGSPGSSPVTLWRFRVPPKSSPGHEGSPPPSRGQQVNNNHPSRHKAVFFFLCLDVNHLGAGITQLKRGCCRGEGRGERGKWRAGEEKRMEEGVERGRTLISLITSIKRARHIYFFKRGLFFFLKWIAPER